MRFLPTSVHGVIDYLWGLALLASPWIFDFADVPAAKWVALVFGVGAILYYVLTAYELGLLKILPMPMHLILDGIGGIVLAASPFLFGFADQVLWPHLLFGLFSVVACFVTRLEPMLSTGHREPA
ncbi:SPW repeat protein [Microvirga sp. BT689]|uniref:SPW repeat domain-containing protein n=1 Tax=Microvirga arvi TaxID=2778731 RepID=UPI001950646D|nr:SPW repeat protein [Microvirga arvi]MBM6579269.1 SPW repeat protein [Microvirga arvi]